jgi:hypothetical protein
MCYHTSISNSDDSMNSISINAPQNATTKSHKIHLGQSVIARKIIAFQELTNLKRQKKSAREAADILEVPNSTMQSWREQKNSQKAPVELVEFFSTPVGADFLQRNVMAVMKLMKCGPGGIRGMQEYLRNSGLDHFVASSEGALQNFWVRCETYILSFGEREEKGLALGMRQRNITVGLDEMFRSRRPCLVAIEVVSNYILVEKFTEDRTAETWAKELKPRLNDVNIQLGQVVSDLCGGIRACTKTLGAVHIAELFHSIYEISKATSAPLAAQEREFEKDLNEAEERLTKVIQKHGEGSEKAKEALGRRNLKRIGLQWRKERRDAVRRAKKELSKINHPIELRTGKLQTAEMVKDRFNDQFKIIDESAKAAELSQSCVQRLGKARKAFDAIVGYMTYFFIMYAAFVGNLKLDLEQEKLFNEVIFPLSYLRMIWKRLPKKEREALKPLREDLEAKLQNALYSREIKNELLKKGQELAETFQRSSSCVEGRNGVLSLNHHRFHRLNARSLRVLTIIHNFDVRRSDGTTAAERFFEAKHENLFESLVANVRIPGRPQQQHHDIQKRLIGRNKRLAA